MSESKTKTQYAMPRRRSSSVGHGIRGTITTSSSTTVPWSFRGAAVTITSSIQFYYNIIISILYTASPWGCGTLPGVVLACAWLTPPAQSTVEVLGGRSSNPTMDLGSSHLGQHYMYRLALLLANRLTYVSGAPA